MMRNALQAEATTIVGLGAFVGITVALALGKVSLDVWLAVSSTCLVLIGVPQRPASPTTNIAAGVAVVPPPAPPASPERP